MFRDRTNLFISYRRTFPHHNFEKKNKKKKKTRFDTLPEEEQGLMSNQLRVSGEYHDATQRFDDSGDNQQDIELSTLPPVFIDIADEIDSILGEIDVKTESLTKLYKKNLLPGFNDRTMDEEEIEKLNYVITSKFQNCFMLIKKLELMRKKNSIENNFKTKSDIIMLDNIKKNYALKIQQASSNFRKLQNNYIKFLKEDDFEPITSKKPPQHLNTYSESGDAGGDYDPVLEELETAEAEQYSRNAIQQTQTHLRQNNQLDSLIREREMEINKIAKGVLEVSAIFKEMQNMVIEQGTVLDRIDYNLENTKVDLQQASKELTRATNYQKQTNKCKLILLLSLIVFALLIILIIKPKGNTSNSGSGKNESKPSSGNSDKGDVTKPDVNLNQVDEVT